MACVYAAAFGAIQQMPHRARLEEVRTLLTEQTSAVQSFPGIRRPHRPDRAGVPRRHHRPPAASVHLQIPGLVLLPLVFLFVPTTGLALAQDFLRRHGDDRAVQFLGRRSRASARHLQAPAKTRANISSRMIGTCAALSRLRWSVDVRLSVPIKLAHAAIVGTRLCGSP